MPFGRKISPSTGRLIDFDKLYRTCIQTAVQAEGAVCIRADEEAGVGFIHKPIYSRLMHSELVIADLTTSNPNVVYELGIRHAVRSHATLLIIAQEERLPFDLNMYRAITYALDDGDSPSAESAVSFTTHLRTWVREALKPASSADSPLFLLFDDFPGPNLAKVERVPELFLSYARADAEKVKPIYDKLRASGFAPWMDTEDILAGERFETKISQAIKKTDFFLAFLSSSSVDRRGVLRTEVRQALAKWNEMLEDDIYLIPIRLEPLDLPEEFASFQALDAFAPDWEGRLQRAIKAGMKKRASETKQDG
jgi:hypothetical protein